MASFASRCAEQGDPTHGRIYGLGARETSNSGAGHCRAGATYMGDGMLAIALNVEHFTPLADFRRHVAELAAYVKDCPTAPGVERIYVPGEIELLRRAERHRTGIPIERGTWDQISQICRRFDIDPAAVMQG